MEMLEKARVEGWTDEEVVNCILGGELELYEIIMRRYNQRLCRVVMSIVRDGAEAENVKVRLHRGRAMVRRDLFARVGAMAKDAFPFLGARCDRMVERVFERLSALKSANLSL